MDAGKVFQGFLPKTHAINLKKIHNSLIFIGFNYETQVPLIYPS